MVGGTFGVAAMGALITGLGRSKHRRAAARAARRPRARSWPTRSAPAARRRGGAGRRRRPAGLRLRAQRRPAHRRRRRRCSAPLLAWLLIADRAEAPAEVERGRAARPSAPRPRRRWPRPSERRHCPAPPLASAAPDAGPRHRRLDAIRALHERERVLLARPRRPERRATSTRSASSSSIPDWRSRTPRSSASARRSTTTATACCIVFYGAHDGEPVEVHVHVSGERGRHVRRAPLRPPAARPARARRATAHVRTEEDLVYRVLDALADSLRDARRPLRGRGRAPRGRSPSSARARRPPAHERAALRALPPAADRDPPARHARAAAATCSRRCPASSATSRATPSATSTTTSCVDRQRDRLPARAARPRRVNVLINQMAEPR